MGLGDDERGQSIQIGAIILFGALVIAMSSYQAFVVPDQNQQIEFNHNQEVQGQLNDLRSTVVSMAGATTPQAATVGLGVDYPSRALFVNPGSASGSLRTAGTGTATVNVTVDNATATGETGDFWNGSARAYNTGRLVYAPNYNLYDSAPETVYSNTVLFNDFGDRTLAESEQALIADDRITVVTLNGSYSTTTAGTASVDFQPVSTAAKTVSVTNETGGNLTLRLTTRLNESEWKDLLDDEMVENGGNVVTVSTSPLPDRPDRLLRIELAGDRTYRLQMFKVGVGSKVSGTEEAYLTDVDGEGATVQKGSATDIVLEVRDPYNNPKAGVTVNASAAAGAFADADNRTASDADGRVTFTYNSSGVPAGTTQQLNFTLGERGPGFNHSTPENVTVNVSVQSSTDGSGGGGGAYDIQWVTNDGKDLTLDLAGSNTVSQRLVANASIVAEGLEFDYAVNDSTIATVAPGQGETNSTGYNETTLAADETGTVAVYVVSGGSGDVINVTVEDSGSNGAASQVTSDNHITINSSGEHLFFRFDTGGSTFTAVNASVDTTNMPEDDRTGLNKIWINSGVVYNAKGGEYASDGTTIDIDDTSVTGSTSIRFGSFTRRGGEDLPGAGSDYSFQSSQPTSSDYIVVDIGFDDGTTKTFYIEYLP